MQVSNPNNIKIYNLSAGKSLPEWLSDRKRRSLLKKDVDIQRRIELLQDFEMPTVSNCIKMTPDNRYLFVTGVYKPRVRCYDVSQMSMKFERCMDSEVVKFDVLSDDYSKLVFLQSDRYVEFHAQYGRYYRTRIPKYGRDMAYHSASCDMYFVGVSPEVYRLNLEQGRFLNPLKTSANEILCCQINPHHNLFTCGTAEGKVEAWDPRCRTRAGILDVATGISAHNDGDLDGLPAVTALTYRDGLNMAVGTSTGHVALYDIRSPHPVLVKDHMYGLPIKKVAFHQAERELVISIDKKILKIWDRNNGKAFTSVEPGTYLNDLCVVQGSGLFFLATEAPKMLTYYIPTLGPAPKWCAFLDSMTEELEESATPMVYDDYKFATRHELEELGLTHLIGSNLLRAYMHGYFMDMRLFRKAKAIADPFAYDEYRMQKIKQKMDEQRANRVQIKKLPKVNKMLAEKLMDQEEEPLKKKKGIPNLLKDERFSALFANPDFEVDTESPDYRLLNPVVSKLDKQRMKKKRHQEVAMEIEEDEEREGHPSDVESDSSDDDREWEKEVQQQHRQIRQEEKMKKREEYLARKLKPKFMELKSGEDFSSLHAKKKRESRKSLGDRVQKEVESGVATLTGAGGGSREMTFSLRKSEKDKQRRVEAREHHQERKELRRSAGDITKKIQHKPKYWMGKRVQ
ncbi:nucleolar protein 10-like [Lineus longissimus]|uniref:nucleolar protein 10-like n=1 Tax=Lineus longissimus TaxID=88925 RepID=UPI002B4E89D3